MNATAKALLDRLLVLRATRDGLLLKSRTVKVTPAWKATYRAVTAELNAVAADLRTARRMS